MCSEGITTNPLLLRFVPDQFKTSMMCVEAARKESWALQYVPDWCVTQERAEIWHEDINSDDEYEPITWCNGYARCKAQKTETKEKLMPTAWHPSRWWD